jgi:predicted SAM-dependent methyltransferase
MGLKLEVGPEKNKHTKRFRFSSDWTTMGLSDKNTDLDIVSDMNHRWPLKDGVCDIVYASHVLEHAKNPIHWIKEAYRVLHRGGIVRVSVPDAATLMHRYLEGKGGLFDFARNFRSWHGSPDTKAHWHPFDMETCYQLLRNGVYPMLGVPDVKIDLFRDVVVNRDGNGSISEEMRDPYFSNRPMRSIFSEGKKPI